MAPTSRRWRSATATSARSVTRWPCWWSGWAPRSSRRDAPRSTREPPMDHWERDDTDEPQLVRPYTLTAGRTDSRINLQLEAPVETGLAPQKPPRWPGNDVRGQILTLCTESPSVAEGDAVLSL